MSIDFSKAPEGATHYIAAPHGVVFYKVDAVGEGWAFSGGVWCRCARGEGAWLLSNAEQVPTFEPFASVEDAPTTGRKHDTGKPLMGAVPPNALLAVTRVLTFGAEKYGRDNWRQVENAGTRYLDAALRHINAYQRGEAADPESGESHLAHAVCSLMFMLELLEGE